METISFINTATTEEIISRKELISKINSRPQLVGQTLMYFVVRKKNERLIDHFLSNGAEKGKTLMYISQLKNYEIFQKYYILYQQDLSEDDYFLVLRKTAQVNFTQGYRLLVNARRFEDLRPTYKEDVTRLYETNKGRMPASLQEK